MNVSLRALTDAAADAVARAIVTVHRDAAREEELRDAKYRARLAELEARILSVADLERRIGERLASLKDGSPGASVSLEDVEPILTAEINRRFAEIPLPKDGKDAEPVSDERLAMAVSVHMASNPAPKGDPGAPGKDADSAAIAELVIFAVAALPPAKDGEDGKDADPAIVKSMVAEAVREAVAALPPAQKGDPGPMGSLPPPKPWEDRIYYEGNAVTHGGSLYQAARDTAKEPPHVDWVCLASAGRDGADGRSFTIRGTFQDGESYKRLDVVVLDGNAFSATRDSPGPCPSQDGGWQLIAKQGKQGKPGDPGRPGRVERGPKVQSISADGEGMLTLCHEDGSEVTCDLYPLLAKLK